MPFSVTTRIRLSHTDAAGVVFFPQALVLAHEAYEQFMDDHGCGLSKLMAEGWGIPVVQASVSWLSPLCLGNDVTITLHATRIGSSSFTLAHSLAVKDVVAARCETVHVCMHNGAKASLLQPLREALQSTTIET
jgi:YbgC/YbaW family acyl-CoA thioester hydrolase